MNTEPVKTESGGFIYTVDAIPEDDERQEELNRTMRKPGEPGYCAPYRDGDRTEQQKNPHDAATAESANG